MTLEQVANVGLRIGEIVLKSGAEVYRAEFSIEKALEAFNVTGDVFVISTGIFITVNNEDGEIYTKIKRIKGKSANFHRLELINNLSRELWYRDYTYEEIMHRLNAIEETKCYGLPVQLLAAFGLSTSFSFFFEATMVEALISGLVASCAYMINVNFLFKYLGLFFNNLITSIFITAVCVGVFTLFPFLRLLQLIIGGIMVIVPGVAITSAMKDALNSDVLSSGYAFSEVILTALAIGSGISLTLSILLGG